MQIRCLRVKNGMFCPCFSDPPLHRLYDSDLALVESSEFSEGHFVAFHRACSLPVREGNFFMTLRFVKTIPG
jgi:hypothetical protein